MKNKNINSEQINAAVEEVLNLITEKHKILMRISNDFVLVENIDKRLDEIFTPEIADIYAKSVAAGFVDSENEKLIREIKKLVNNNKNK